MLYTIDLLCTLLVDTRNIVSNCYYLHCLLELKKEFMALSDEEVINRILEMEKYIFKESQKKIDAIDFEAENECASENYKYKLKERLKIDKKYQQKITELNREMAISISTIQYDGRLCQLKVKHSHISEIITKIWERFSKVDFEAHKYLYRCLLTYLIVEGLCMMLEKEVVLRFRKCDVPLAEQALKNASIRYRTMTSLPVKLQIDQENYLPQNTFGGVDLIAADGKVFLANNLLSRLKHILERTQPLIRAILYGVNPRRAFTN